MNKQNGCLAERDTHSAVTAEEIARERPEASRSLAIIETGAPFNCRKICVCVCLCVYIWDRVGEVLRKASGIADEVGAFQL